MAARDESGRASRHEDEVSSLTAQISFLDEEIAVLRRRLADSPRQVRLLEERLRETEASLTSVTSQNERLASTLREARDQIVALKEEVDRLAQPPSGFGVFLAAHEDNTADVFTGGRKMRVNVSPNVDLEELRPGQEVVLNEALNIVIAQGFETVGEVVMLKELLADGERALVISHADEERIVRLAAPLLDQVLRGGDSLLLEPRSGYVYERIPKAEVEELILEEVPDIAYTDIGGLGRADRADPRRDRAALPARGPVPRAPAAAAEGRAALRPARLRQDAHRQGGGELPGQAGRGQDGGGLDGSGSRGGQDLLPQHQGPGAAEQVRRRDRAAHPPGLPAGPGEGLRGHAGDRVLRRDGLDLPHPRLRRLLRRGEHDRPAAAVGDRRRRGPGERHRHRRLQPRGHDRPGDPAARPPGRQDQDRAAGRRGGQGHLLQVRAHRAAAAPRRPGRARRLARRPRSTR